MIHERILAVMKDIPFIGKDRKNTGQGYNFRGIDDVYLAVQPVLAKHGVFMSAEILESINEERTSKSGGAITSRMLRIRYSFVAEDGTSVHTDSVGEGMDSGDKASAKAMSIAQKYAILQMFLIPTSEPKDPEEDDHEVEPKRTPSKTETVKDRTPEEEKLAERYKFVLKAHAKIGAKVCAGIFEDVAEWNNGRKDDVTIKAWEAVLDAWADGLVTNQDQVAALTRGLSSGDLSLLDRRIADLAAKKRPDDSEEPWAKGRE